MFQPDRYFDPAFLDLLSWTFGNAESYDQHKDIYIDADNDENRLTASQVKTYIKKLIGGFRDRGLKPGDCVCVHAFNNIWYAVIYLAVIGAGAHIASSNPGYKTAELENVFSLSNAKFVIVEPELLQGILAATKRCRIQTSNILVLDPKADGSFNGFDPIGALLNADPCEWEAFDDEKKSKATTAVLMFTSGTTGLPKAARLSHFSLVSMNLSTCCWESRPYEVIRLFCLHQFHSFNASISLVSPLRYGQTTYIMRRYTIASYLDCIHRYQITETTTVPHIVYSILSSPTAAASLSSIRLIWCAGSPLTRDTQQQVTALLSQEARFYQVYGTTEIGWITTFGYPEEDDSGSVGRLVPNMECKIVDSYGKEIPEERCSGKLLIRAPSLMDVYIGNPEATRNAFVKGWLDTGDIGYCDQGKWYVVGREKDMIKVRGLQVSPSELEACLLTHPSILDAAVIGIQPPGSQTELPRAYVVAKEQVPPLEITEAEVYNYLQARLASYKSLTGGVKFIESIPRNGTGKIARNQLREMAAKECE